MEKQGWDGFEIGAMLRTFEELYTISQQRFLKIALIHNQARLRRV